jgi:hypothetical protein
MLLASFCAIHIFIIVIFAEDESLFERSTLVDGSLEVDGSVEGTSASANVFTYPKR